MSDGNQYSNSIALDLCLCSDSVEIEKFIAQGVKKSKRSNTLQFNNCLNLVVNNLYLVDRYDPGKYIAYPRGKSWKPLDNPRSIKVTPLVRAIDTLEELGYVENKKGFKNRQTGKGFISRMRMTEAMREQLIKVELLRDDPILRSMYRHPKESIIRMRDESKQFVWYKKTAKVKAMENKLKYYNRLLTDTELTWRDLVFNPVKKRLYRVFNNRSWDQGGRFYGGWWQGVTGDDRKFIKIEGQPTVEHDYSGMQVRLLYAKEGIVYGGNDTYAVPGREDDRDLLKLVLLIALNAHKGKDSAIKAILDKMEGYPKQKRNKAYLSKIIDEFEGIHKPISKYFYSGIGLKLQYIDSQVAEEILYNLAMKGILALPVHDSFICSIQYQDELLDQMNSCYYDIVGEYPVIKQVA